MSCQVCYGVKIVKIGGGWVLSKCVGIECPLPPIAHSFFLSYYIFFFLSMVYG